jgi:hypothetical protein
MRTFRNLTGQNDINRHVLGCYLGSNTVSQGSMMFSHSLGCTASPRALLYLDNSSEAHAISLFLEWLRLEAVCIRSWHDARKAAETTPYALIITSHAKARLAREISSLPVIEIDVFLFDQRDATCPAGKSRRFNANAFMRRICLVIDSVHTKQRRPLAATLAPYQTVLFPPQHR